MRRTALARRAIADLAGIGLEVLNELGDVLRRHIGMGLEIDMHARHGGNRRQIARRVEGELLVDHRIDRDRSA
ncbi:hypothetical protein D3C78_1929880 [compost metagenome]